MAKSTGESRELRQKATEIESTDGLSGERLKALEALLAGATVSAAAEKAGVNRTTLHRWLRHDHPFRAALNSARLAYRDAAFARLDSLSEKAIDVVRNALEEGSGDPRTAVAVLRGLGLLSGVNSPDSDDADVLREEAEASRLSRIGESKHKALLGRLHGFS